MRSCPPLLSLHTMSLAQYEVQRLENIRANEAALASLGLASDIGDALAHKPRRTSVGTQRTVKKKARRRSAVTATKVRDMSARARFLSDREERERREARHRDLQAQRERERQRTLKRARDVRAAAHRPPVHKASSAHKQQVHTDGAVRSCRCALLCNATSTRPLRAQAQKARRCVRSRRNRFPLTKTQMIDLSAHAPEHDVIFLPSAQRDPPPSLTPYARFSPPIPTIKLGVPMLRHSAIYT